MPLPNDIVAKLTTLVADADTAALKEAADALTIRYRDRNSRIEPGFLSEAECLAYVAMRMPATYAACQRVFADIRSLVPALQIGSMLDVGSGPGTCFIAADESFGDIERAVLVEPSKAMAALGSKLWQHDVVEWRRDLIESVEPFDLVAASYVLGEIAGNQEALIEQLWASAGSVLVLIEPGSREGFKRLRRARDQIVADNGHVLAPCTHQATCPMLGDDWCHFSVPVQRTALHRQLKGATRPDESEKFSYLVTSRQKLGNPGATRIVKRPIKAKGHVHLDICGANGLQRVTPSRRDGSIYKTARKANWGDLWHS